MDTEGTLRASERDERLSEIEVLTRSSARFELLELLCESPRSRTDLQRRLGIHRTTLRENLHKLEAANWIEAVPAENAYRALPSGRIAMRSIRETMGDFRAADRLGAFLARLPEALPACVHDLRTCNVTLCESHSPYAPMERFVKLVRETESFRGFAPVFNPLYVESFGARIADGHDFEIIGPPGVLGTIRSSDPDAFETAVDAESTRLLVAEDLPRFGVALLDETVVIAAYDEDMRTHSILEACDEQRELVEWAERRYETERRAADEYEGPPEER